MVRQDKATTEEHARILKKLLTLRENKYCADCKRQDARWASWNIGVFICIRCSGVHRSMGTHISKVKSVDLDTWTPEQMESIQKWGNHRANLYWEAHLRPGHMPPEHKLDSFIRSKYEFRKWAREGPPPTDPSVLESPDVQSTDVDVSSNPTHTPAIEASSSLPSPPAAVSQPQPHRLLSARLANRPTASQPTQPVASSATQTPDAKKPESTSQEDLFSLDFHAPAPTVPQQQVAPKKDVKNDILSLFSAASPGTGSVSGQTAVGQFGVQNDQLGQWNQPKRTVQAQPHTISMMGTSGVAMWGAQSGWTPNTAPAQPDVWSGFQSTSGQTAPAISQQTSTNSLFDTQNVWGSSNGTGGPGGGSSDLFGTPVGSTAMQSTTTKKKKDDVFGDLWGDFK